MLIVSKDNPGSAAEQLACLSDPKIHAKHSLLNIHTNLTVGMTSSRCLHVALQYTRGQPACFTSRSLSDQVLSIGLIALHGSTTAPLKFLGDSCSDNTQDADVTDQ